MNKLHGLIIVLLFFLPRDSQAYDVWIGTSTPVPTNSYWYKLVFEYSISGTDSPEQDVLAPHNGFSTGNKFGPMPYTGLPCEDESTSGGQACNQLMVARYVPIKPGDTWNVLFRKFISKYGASGKFEYLGIMNQSTKKYFRWDLLCLGFAVQSSPNGVGVLHLAPGSICGRIPNPDVKCDVTLPGNIDFGTVNVGATNISQVVHGQMACDQKATLSASLLNSPVINGAKVDVYLNGTALISDAIDVVNNSENSVLELRADINGNLMTPGEHESTIIIQIAYR